MPPIIQLEAAPTVSSDRPIFNGCQLTLDRRIGSDDVTDVYSDPRLKVIDRRDGRIVQALGRVGRGPLEFRTPIGMFWSTVRPGALEIYDQVNRRLSRFSVDAPSGTGEWTLPPLHEALDRLERGEAPGDIQLCSD